MSSTLTVVLWNVQWRAPVTAAGQTIRRLIAAQNPDLVCLTESHCDALDRPHMITSDPDYGAPTPSATRRKVVLWSRQSWSAVDALGDPHLPGGRFLRGVTATPLGALAVLGICIPWSHAGVTTGRRDRTPWQQHDAYLDGLASIVRRDPPVENTILLGDFNQALPRTRAPKTSHEALTALLEPHLSVATTGTVPGLVYPAIDHLAHSRDLEAIAVKPLANHDDQGARLSDHVGLVVTLRRRRG